MHLLTLCILGNFSCFFCCQLIIFKINFFEKFFQEYHQSVIQIGSRTGPTCCRALSWSKLQRLSADDTSKGSSQECQECPGIINPEFSTFTNLKKSTTEQVMFKCMHAQDLVKTSIS